MLVTLTTGPFSPSLYQHLLCQQIYAACLAYDIECMAHKLGIILLVKPNGTFYAMWQGFCTMRFAQKGLVKLTAGLLRCLSFYSSLSRRSNVLSAPARPSSDSGHHKTKAETTLQFMLKQKKQSRVAKSFFVHGQFVGYLFSILGTLLLKMF